MVTFKESFEYNDMGLVVTSADGSTKYYQIDAGKLISSEWQPYSFSYYYDGGLKPVRIEEKVNGELESTSKYTYDANGNLIKDFTDFYSGNYYVAYTYTDIIDKCNIDICAFLGELLPAPIIDKNVIGSLANKHLMLTSKYESEYESEPMCTWSYKFDEDGYPIEIKREWDGDDDYELFTLTYTK